MTTVLQENLTGVRVVRAFANQAFEIEKFEEKTPPTVTRFSTSSGSSRATGVHQIFSHWPRLPSWRLRVPTSQRKEPQHRHHGGL